MTSPAISSGHSACAGCGEIIGERMVLEALGKDVIVCQATGCMEITTSPYPRTAFKVPWIHVAFEDAENEEEFDDPDFEIVEEKLNCLRSRVK